MNFDLISTTELSASAVLVGLTITTLFGRTFRQRLLIGASLVLWFTVVLSLGASGAINGGQGVFKLARFPTAVFLPLLLLCLFAFAVPANRQRIREASLFPLIFVQSLRVLGVSFVLLQAAHRLPAPFAPVAGWGDILIGAAALIFSYLLSSFTAGLRTPLLVWNVFGVIDLVTAITLGALSSPGPIRIFWQQPGAAAMTTLPWIIIPCFLVPQFLFLHFVVFFKMKEPQPVTTAQSSLKAQAMA